MWTRMIRAMSLPSLEYEVNGFFGRRTYRGSTNGALWQRLIREEWDRRTLLRPVGPRVLAQDGAQLLRPVEVEDATSL